VGRWRSFAALAVVGALVVVVPGPARSAVAASRVSNVMVDDSSPSAAAGAKTVYVVTFTTSRAGGLSNAAGSTIKLAFPSDTNMGTVSASSVDDTTTGANGIGTCNPTPGGTIICSLNPGASIAGDDSVRVTLDGVTNPSTPSDWIMSVSTTSDTAPANSPPYSVVPAHHISQPRVDNSSPSAAAGATTDYVVTFTTSATGGLSNVAGSAINLVFPSGTGLASVSASSVDDTTTATNGVGACNPPSGETITCFLNPGLSIAAGDSVRVTLDGVTNPSTPSPWIMSASTTSDTSPVNSAPYGVKPPPPGPIPVPGKSVVAAALSGDVLVKQPGQTSFRRLGAGQQIAVGSIVNATHGVVSLVVARDFHGHTARSQAHAGVFSVKQRQVGETELTFLALVGRRPTGCPARTATVARRRRHRALWIRDPGYFVGVGIHASVRDESTHGANWLTEDTCRGTLVRVKTGAVLVHDFPHHRTFVLRAGHQFLVHRGKGG
jgi:hypothetical protein